MLDALPGPCRYSAAGHAHHLIQFKLAFRAGPPETMRIVGEHERGIVIAPPADPDHIQVWCMHAQWRDVVHRAMARGATTVEMWQHNLARIDDFYISFTSPQHWRECPTAEEMTPLMTGYVTKDQLLDELTRRHEASLADGAER